MDTITSKKENVFLRAFHSNWYLFLFIFCLVFVSFVFYFSFSEGGKGKAGIIYTGEERGWFRRDFLVVYRLQSGEVVSCFIFRNRVGNPISGYEDGRISFTMRNALVTLPRSSSFMVIQKGKVADARKMLMPKSKLVCWEE